MPSQVLTSWFFSYHHTTIFLFSPQHGSHAFQGKVHYHLHCLPWTNSPIRSIYLTPSSIYFIVNSTSLAFPPIWPMKLGVRTTVWPSSWLVILSTSGARAMIGGMKKLCWTSCLSTKFPLTSKGLAHWKRISCTRSLQQTYLSLCYFYMGGPDPFRRFEKLCLIWMKLVFMSLLLHMLVLDSPRVLKRPASSLNKMRSLCTTWCWNLAITNTWYKAEIGGHISLERWRFGIPKQSRQFTWIWSVSPSQKLEHSKHT